MSPVVRTEPVKTVPVDTLDKRLEQLEAASYQCMLDCEAAGDRSGRDQSVGARVMIQRIRSELKELSK